MEETELNPVEELIEMAARRHHEKILGVVSDSRVWPNQFTWDELVAMNEYHVLVRRLAMMLALKEILVIPADWQPEHWGPAIT